jgi:cytochrome d ubiquinol oxidase subunit I
MSFQFGTNWPGYMEKVGNIAGPLLAMRCSRPSSWRPPSWASCCSAAGASANRVHTVATLLVAGRHHAVGLLDPGAELLDADARRLQDDQRRAHVTSWFEAIFNPSFPYRLTHMLLASGLTVASFLVAGVSAWLAAQPTAGPSVMAS